MMLRIEPFHVALGAHNLGIEPFQLCVVLSICICVFGCFE
jgi:hypothetical protein